MRSLLLLFVLLLNTVAYSQTVFAPLGANWNYSYDGHNGGYSEDWCIKVINDSIVDGYPTKYLERTSVVTMSFPPNSPIGTVYEYYIGFLQDRNDSIFYNNRFLYSFAMNVDDTITIDPSFPNLIAVVDTVYDTIVVGNTLSTWQLTKYCYEFGTYNEFGKTQIIEDIGPINDYLFWNTDGCPIGGGWWYFQCYASSSLNYNLPCNPMSAGISEHKELNITVYPNPVSATLQITGIPISENAIIDIVDAFGRVMLSSNSSGRSEIDLSTGSLSNGVYLLTIRAGDQFSSSRFIKI